MRVIAGILFLGGVIWLVGLPFIGFWLLLMLMLLAALGNFALGEDYK